MELSQDAITERLENWPIARLASKDGDGRLHQVPIVFARSGGRLWSPIDGKPKRDGELVRVRNLRDNPEASLLLDDYQSDWARLWWIRIEATAEVIQPASSDDPEVSAAIEALEAKYQQYATISVLGAPATLIAFASVKIVSWTASPLAS
jgi:PPOX class probable F420-dependent enzyme